MFNFARWRRVAGAVSGAMCCALVGATAVPAVAGAAAAHSVASSQMWAVVSAKGTLVRGNGATSATRISKGRYLVRFSSSMAKCGYEATAGSPGGAGIEFPIEVTVGQPSGKPKALFIQTFSLPSQTLVDEPFHVTTYCGGLADFAVVGGDGTLARGSHVVSSSSSGTGGYDVVFDHDVHRYAFTATIGSAIPGEVFVPGAITVANLAGNKNGVFVQTMSPTGLDSAFPFHLAVNCDATSLFGVVNADGSTARGNNVVSTEKVPGQPSGLYEVFFNRNVTACAYTATVDGPFTVDTSDDPITITTASVGKNKPNGVFLTIENPAAGNVQDEPFHLVVTC